MLAPCVALCYNTPRGDTMKSRWNLISSIVQLAIGGAAVLSFVVLAICGEDMSRWIVTLILSVIYVVLGVCGLVDDIKSRKK